MDRQAHWLDELLRGMATGTSRRTALGNLARGAAGGLLALAGVSVASADGKDRDTDCKRAGKACKKNGQCCSNICKDGVCCSDFGQSCTSDRECCSGVCDPLYQMCV
jgi:hypothetical protein